VIAKKDLLKVKTRALRLNIWFKALSKIERAILDLTLKCVERVRSHTLEAAISTIIEKILKAFECRFIIKAEKVGREIARQVCIIAEKWGNKDASTWKLDEGFIRFLGINAVNQ